ncbi:hypothetical protein OJF2_69750 [Aquisphaera giovannonii]|uniref:RiboL-PSP-HEPN domain-containing protein n=1 Tax=Aquisphaera giovannonii TaxID=406548 RepID=A0A5B9WDM9_9BACT|nr:hypothetical protein [Aquisphaera giovannonii]QEH38374.1 hypothetical protein OJF2_69750 [Aquisphaera giovannonii]
MSASTAGGPEPQTLDEILDWHEGVVDALVAQRAAVRLAATMGSAVSARFVGMTLDELEAYFDLQRRELDRLTVLNLVASVEASIRADFSRRVEGKRKDPLAKDYRKWHKTLSSGKKRRPDFDEEGILDLVKENADRPLKNLVGRFRECLRARHWVGHGRYWSKPPGMDSLDPVEVFERCRALLQAWPD